MPVSDYEKQRIKNIEENKRILADIGLLNPYRPFTVIKKPCKRRRTDVIIPGSGESHPSTGAGVTWRRRSCRLRGTSADAAEALGSDYNEEFESETNSETSGKYVMRPNLHGNVPGVEVGNTWRTRLQCSSAGVHRPTIAGIHGHAREGAYSIALSGGYEDNIDLGECFTYTGEGGRDLRGTPNNPKNLRTAAQSRDQTLTKGNLALCRSVDTRQPVRVIRGYKLNSPFAPEDGYRYDGLYLVTKSWYATGLSGYGVWKYALKRCEDQAPPPWTIHTVIEPVHMEHCQSLGSDGSASQEDTSSDDQ